MNKENSEEVIDLFSRLLDRVQQMGKEQQGCNIQLVYVASGGQHIQHQNNYYGAKKNVGGNERDPYEALLLQIIEPLKEGRNWKAILLPYCAGVQEGVLPQWSHAHFVQKTGVAVPAASYSEWTRKDKFSFEELESYAEQFAQLKRQIDNSK
ncbi:MAG: hypothetical protein IKP41_03795 [Bacteroidaceae bacterium]|nr:hypothetical protein [Bacteroidaceae bacterium]